MNWILIWAVGTIITYCLFSVIKFRERRNPFSKEYYEKESLSKLFTDLLVYAFLSIFWFILWPLIIIASVFIIKNKFLIK